MKQLCFVFFFTIIFLISSLSFAEIYGWTDENGVKRFSNEPPPGGTKILYQKEEVRSLDSVGPKPEGSEKKYLSNPTPEKKDQEGQSASQKAESASISEAPPEGDTTYSDDEDFHRKRIERRVRKTHSVVEDKSDVITKPGNQKDEVRKEARETKIKNKK